MVDCFGKLLKLRFVVMNGNWVEKERKKKKREKKRRKKRRSSSAKEILKQAGKLTRVLFFCRSHV